mmetsp:Transcript_34137/g.58711  ORF Transcript_34137/g.58711 Transcript_34137/m.58711 type:complete len:265 (-) Transcript_34137:629-1423(-)
MASAQRGRVDNVTKHLRTRLRTRLELDCAVAAVAAAVAAPVAVVAPVDAARSGFAPGRVGGPKRSTSRAAACATMGASSGSRSRALSSSMPIPSGERPSDAGASTDASTTRASVASVPAPASVEISFLVALAVALPNSPPSFSFSSAAPFSSLAPPCPCLAMLVAVYAAMSMPPFSGSSMNMLSAVSTSRRVLVARRRWPSRALIESESAQSEVSILRAARWIVLASAALTAGAPVLSMDTVETTRLSHAAPSPSARAERCTFV